MAPFAGSSLWNVYIWLHVHVVVPVLLVMLSVTISQPIPNRVNRAIDWDSCEFGNTYQPYDEDCPNGAIQVLPCNPGQLKVSECIGQDGDTSRMCDPCPQKYYQSYYNRCTRCRECSECGPNEYIREPCTDESDTVCESIIPPDPVPTTTPKRTTTHVTTQGSTQSSTYRSSVTTTELSSPGTNHTHAVTYRNIVTTEISFLTTLAEREEPEATYRGINTLGLTLSAVIIIIFLFVIVFILLTINWKQRKKIKDLKIRINNYKGIEMERRLSDSKNSHNDPTTVTSENVYEESSKMLETDTCETQRVRLTVQVNNRNAESENGEKHHGLQGSGGEDSEKSESDLEAPLEASNGNRNRNYDDMHKDYSRGGDNDDRRAPIKTGVPKDMATDVEGRSTALRQTDVHRDATSSTVPSPDYEEPSTRGSEMKDFSGSCATGSERTSGGARADLPQTSSSMTPTPKKGGFG